MQVLSPLAYAPPKAVPCLNGNEWRRMEFAVIQIIIQSQRPNQFQLCSYWTNFQANVLPHIRIPSVNVHLLACRTIYQGIGYQGNKKIHCIIDQICMLDPEADTLSLNKLQDHERTITGLTPFKKSMATSHSLAASQERHSTFTIELAMQELPHQAEHRLNSRILKHTAITEKMRARVRVSLMGECAKQWLFRETCVLACTLADLYLKRGGGVEVEQYQGMAVACLIIAAKTRQGAFPAISEKAFRREELIQWEAKVVTTLGFKLNPNTYYSHGQRTVLLWDNFVVQERCYNLRLSEQSEGVNFKLRRFFQQLDSVFMALESLDFEVEALVVNLFYLHARMLNVYEIDSPHALSPSQFTTFFYPSGSDKFRLFFGRFVQRYFSSLIVVDDGMGCFLRPFLGVAGQGRPEWPWERREHYQKIREWDEVQTLPKDCYNSVKNILSRMKMKN